MKRFLSLFFLLAFLVGISYATTTTDSINYFNSVNLTSNTFNGLAASATAGASTAAYDNSSNLYDDVLVTVRFTTGSGAVGGSSAVYVYIAATEDGTNWEQEESNQPGTDAAYTINTTTVFRPIKIIPVKTASKIYEGVFTVAGAYGGVVPRKFCLILINDTGQTLAGGSVSYSGIKYTNQ